MFTTIYQNYAGYIWMICLCAVTFFIMLGLKKSFTKLTGLLYEKKVFSDKEKVVVNLVCGLAFSISVSYVLGRFAAYLVGQTVEWKWFVFAGLLATGIYLAVEKVKNASVNSLGNALIESIKASNLEINEKDAPSIARKLVEQAKQYQNSCNNTHNNVLESISNGIGGILDISNEQISDLEKTVAELKSRGYDTHDLEKSIQAARSDGHVTADEFKALVNDLKVLIQKYHA